MRYFIAFALFLVYYTKAEEEFLPEYIQPCNLKEDKFQECMKQQIEDSLKNFTLGIPELDVPSIDPVNLDDILIDGSGLKLKFTEAQMHGLADSKVNLFNVVIGQEEENFKLVFVANLSLTAQYNADGQILILPIKGEGDSKINCKNVEVEISSKLIHVKGKKGEHFKMVTPNYKYDIESTTFDFKNLFNGNKQLAETTLQFLNENWRQLMEDLAPPVIKQIVKTIVKTINKFFSKVTITRIVKGYKQSS